MPIDFPSSPNPNDTYLHQSTNQVKNAYLYMKYIANGEFAGAVDV
jgi:hypothetical protein